MRGPSWLVARHVALSEPEKPTFDDPSLRARLQQLGRSLRRRFTDRLEDLIDEARLVGDLATAELLALARQRASQHGCASIGHERRQTGSTRTGLIASHNEAHKFAAAAIPTPQEQTPMTHAQG